MTHVQGTVIVNFNKISQASIIPFLLLSQRPVTMLWIGLSPSFRWFAYSFRALIKCLHKPCGTACALNTSACLAVAPVSTTSNLLGAFHSYFLHSLRTTNCSASSFCCCCLLLTSRPTKKLLKRKAIAMWEKILQSDTSLSSAWRDDTPQEICAPQHNSLYDAQSSRLIFCHVIFRRPTPSRLLQD